MLTWALPTIVAVSAIASATVPIPVADPVAPAEAAAVAPPVRLERVSTAVPWPRGLAFVDGELIVLARGRHRRAGGPSIDIQDRAGFLFRVDPSVNEPVVRGETAGEAVRANAAILAEPTSPPFQLWDTLLSPASRDTQMDRPYCTLAYDPVTANYFVCGFSGADLPDGTFRKNATDSVLRYDTRVSEWKLVDVHHEVAGHEVQPEDRHGWMPNDTYPHHDPAVNPPPHGWINGPDGCTVVGRWLYVVAKDNNLLVRYDLSAVRDDPHAPAPPSEPVLGDRAEVLVDGELVEMDLWGHSAVAEQDGWLYVGFRTTSQIVRFPLGDEGLLVEPLQGELIARFDPYDPETGTSADLIDIKFNGRGELFASVARTGSVWNLGVPDPEHVFDGRSGTDREPFADLRSLTSNAKARTGNIAFDDQDRLYVCSGNYDADSKLAGVIYRAVADG